MRAADAIKQARHQAGLTQRALADRAGTSQATLSAYEAGRKQPAADTLRRLLAACGQRLSIEPAQSVVVRVADEELADRGRRLVQVLDLADALPSSPGRELRYPRLRTLASRRS